MKASILQQTRTPTAWAQSHFPSLYLKLDSFLLTHHFYSLSRAEREEPLNKIHHFAEADIKETT